MSESEELKELFDTALNAGLSIDDIKSTAKLKKNVDIKNSKPPRSYARTTLLVLIIAVLYGMSLPNSAYKNPMQYLKSRVSQHVSMDGSCMMTMNENFIELTRKPSNCKFCKGVNQVPVYYNMTKEYFMKHHAYTGVPALIKGGCKEWSALKVFGYKYFSNLYSKNDALELFDERECQFFGYKTNMRTLRDVFEMSKKRAALQKDQWYIGWSNCIEDVQTKLRQHYSRPKFLPDDSESSALDWIFMGGSGTGAMMHIDDVNRPSWQAMIKGSKTWHIQPPPECFMDCPMSLFNATMEAGDVLVIDTNKWFHSTFIHPVGLSITIGSEYD